MILIQKGKVNYNFNFNYLNMFDDINVNSVGGVPRNLPVNEPDDIFAATDAPEVSPSSAISAGKLQPKASLPPMSAPSLSELSEPVLPNRGEPKVQAIPEELSRLNKIKNPTFAKNIMILFIVLVGIGILGGGSWFIYTVLVDKSEDVGEFGLPNNIGTIKTEEKSTTPTPEENTDEAVLFGEPVDSDSDNLTDSQEKELGTNPNDWDTDNDEVSDGDEVLVWKSDPLKLDTDGDGYLDGAEIKNGYNPIGPGKIFDIPKQ